MSQSNMFHSIQSLNFKDDRMILVVDSQAYNCYLPTLSSKLFAASAESRMSYEISPSGYGIYWPSLDLDLSVDGIIRESVPIVLSA